MRILGPVMHADSIPTIERPHVARRLVTGCVLIAIILTFAFALDVSYGTAKIPVGHVARVVLSHVPFVGTDIAASVPILDRNLVWLNRVPRATLALLVPVGRGSEEPRPASPGPLSLTLHRNSPR